MKEGARRKLVVGAERGGGKMRSLKKEGMRERAVKPSREQIFEEKVLEGARARGGQLCKHCNSPWLSPKWHRSHESTCVAAGGLPDPQPIL